MRISEAVNQSYTKGQLGPLKAIVQEKASLISEKVREVYNSIDLKETERKVACVAGLALIGLSLYLAPMVAIANGVALAIAFTATVFGKEDIESAKEDIDSAIDSTQALTDLKDLALTNPKVTHGAAAALGAIAATTALLAPPVLTGIAISTAAGAYLGFSVFNHRSQCCNINNE